MIALLTALLDRLDKWVTKQHQPIEARGAAELACPRCREAWPCKEMVKVSERIVKRRDRIKP